jgi:hypothetical protein
MIFAVFGLCAFVHYAFFSTSNFKYQEVRGIKFFSVSEVGAGLKLYQQTKAQHRFSKNDDSII